jgi:hypothetical protein
MIQFASDRKICHIINKKFFRLPKGKILQIYENLKFGCQPEV